MACCSPGGIRMDVFSVPSLSLLALLRSLLFAGQSLAHATCGATNALIGFCFGNVGGVAFRRGHIMFGDLYPEMRGSLLVTESAPHRRGTHTLPARTFVHEALGNEQLIDVERRSRVFGFSLGVGY